MTNQRLSLGHRPLAALVFALAIVVFAPSVNLFAQAGLRVLPADSAAAATRVFITQADGSLTGGAVVIPLGNFPHYAVMASDNRYAYFSNRDSNSVSVVDAQTETVIQTITVSNSPYGLGFSPQEDRLYVANRLAPAGCVLPTCSPLISVFTRNVTTGLLTLASTIATNVNTAQLRGLSVLPNGRIYVVDQNNSKVIVIDPASSSVIANPSVGNQPLGISANATGTRVYVANFTSSDVSVIDTATNTVIATPDAVSGGTFDTDVTPDGRFFYSVNASGQTVTAFNAATNTIIGAPLATGQDPDGLTISPDGLHLYAANASNTDAIAVFNINQTTGALTVNSSIAAGNNPLDIAMKRFAFPLPSSAAPAPAPTPPTVNTPPPNSGTPSPPRGVNVRRNNLALLIDFSPPAIPNVVDANELGYRVRVYSADGYIVATQDARSSGVLIPYVKNELAYWVSVTAINGFGEGPPSEWFLVAIPDWAFYPKDRDGRPCPTPVQCQ